LIWPIKVDQELATLNRHDSYLMMVLVMRGLLVEEGVEEGSGGVEGIPQQDVHEGGRLRDGHPVGADQGATLLRRGTTITRS
jgi:hypothetical protein